MILCSLYDQQAAAKTMTFLSGPRRAPLNIRYPRATSGNAIPSRAAFSSCPDVLYLCKQLSSRLSPITAETLQSATLHCCHRPPSNQKNGRPATEIHVVPHPVAAFNCCRSHLHFSGTEVLTNKFPVPRRHHRTYPVPLPIRSDESTLFDQ